ncbi:CaiB/BaiF CoA-transferase family protein [Dietzia sp. B32]|uniref:CaiB/BaiF CoA transferase family protein n=1 Tax=Dietzia sp. B32 TaxID=2915130 RepID=UPI0021AD6818|nr:CaiB/BaiF CoA-transferase family protein [Dietzia sp. B32]UVE93821.1 CoA transferase [Dietzia sp. B32]
MNMRTSNESLSGLRVLDLSRVLAGPLCCQLLGDHGAEVIKVEPPAGDDTRKWGPPFVDTDQSAYFSAINRNKTNICLDLSTQEGQEVLAELLARTDVVVENFKTGTLARWGFSDEYLLTNFPRLIVGRITGFGADGPMGGMPGYDAVAQAFGGLMSINGEADGPALRVGVPIVDMVTGLYAFSGILLALAARDRTERGQIVDCTLADTAVSLLHPHSASNLTDGRIPVRTGSAHPTVAPYDTFNTLDGQVFIGVGNDRQFRGLVDTLGAPELADDARFQTNADRLAHLPGLTAVLNSRTACFSKEALARELLNRGIPASAVRDVGEVLRDEHVRHRQMVIEQGQYRAIGIPIKMSATPGTVRSTPRPRGADTRAVLDDIGLDGDQIDHLIDSGVAQESAIAATKEWAAR